jgi:hypothetical protein
MDDNLALQNEWMGKIKLPGIGMFKIGVEEGRKPSGRSGEC